MLVIRKAPFLYRLFISFILMISLLPFKFRYVTLFEKQVSYADFILVFIMLILFPMFFKKGINTQTVDKSVKYLYFILIYAFISTLWVSYDISYWYIFYQLALAFITISIPYLVSKITNDKYIDYHKLISNFSMFLSLVFFVYILQHTNSRVGGYLGGAALIGIVMIPVIAVHFHNLVHKKRILSSSIGFFLTLLAIFLTESRAALVMLILYVAVTVLRKPTIQRLLIIIFLSLIFIFVFFQNISTDRYNRLLDDEARNIAFKTAVEWGTHSSSAFIFGNGYGSIWKWRAFELGYLPSWSYPFQPTEYGYVLFHAHSIFNQLFAELGMIGTVPFLVFLVILIKETWRSWKNKNELKTNILVSIICTIPALHADLLFFRNWEITIVWLFYVFTALNYPSVKIIKKE